MPESLLCIFAKEDRILDEDLSESCDEDDRTQCALATRRTCYPARVLEQGVLNRIKTRGSLRPEVLKDLEESCSSAVGQEAVVPDPHEAIRQDMRQEPADELARIERHGPSAAPVLVVAVRERDLGVFHTHEPVVGHGDAMGVTGEVIKVRAVLPAIPSERCSAGVEKSGVSSVMRYRLLILFFQITIHPVTISLLSGQTWLPPVRRYQHRLTAIPWIRRSSR